MQTTNEKQNKTIKLCAGFYETSFTVNCLNFIRHLRGSCDIPQERGWSNMWQIYPVIPGLNRDESGGLVKAHGELHITSITGSHNDHDGVSIHHLFAQPFVKA